LHQWRFDGDGKAGLEIVGFENAPHAAAIDHVGYLETVIEELARLDFSAHGGGGWFYEVRRATVKVSLFDFVNSD
jgi:hypothetical protein